MLLKAGNDFFAASAAERARCRALARRARRGHKRANALGERAAAKKSFPATPSMPQKLIA